MTTFIALRNLLKYSRHSSAKAYKPLSGFSKKYICLAFNKVLHKTLLAEMLGQYLKSLPKVLI